MCMCIRMPIREQVENKNSHYLFLTTVTIIGESRKEHVPYQPACCAKQLHCHNRLLRVQPVLGLYLLWVELLLVLAVIGLCGTCGTGGTVFFLYREQFQAVLLWNLFHLAVPIYTPHSYFLIPYVIHNFCDLFSCTQKARFTCFPYNMLVKQPKPAYKGFIASTLKAVFVVEALGFAVSYGLWFKLNTERDFRFYMYKNHNWVLEGYYLLGEKIADHKTRQHDLKVWTNEGKI